MINTTNIKAKENEISDLKNEMYEVMGAFVRGKRGNQLLEDERGDASKASKGGDISPAGETTPGYRNNSTKPQFAANDTAVHVTGLDDSADSFFGYKPEDYKDKTGIANSGGGDADFFHDQREGEGVVGGADNKSRIDEKGNVKVSNEEIEAKMKEMFPDNYVEGSLIMTD